MLIDGFKTRNRWVPRTLAWLSSLLLSAFTPSTTPAETSTDGAEPPPAVSVATWRQGEDTHFVIENNELCEVTMTFQMHLVNLKSNASHSVSATFPPGRTEAFTLSPADHGSNWEYSYTNFYKLGSSIARHDDSVAYQLPFAPGTKFKVSQGYHGTYSHTGPNLYAIDWQVAQGTPVYTARGGLVVKVRDNSNKGGGNIKFDKYNNYVLIRHDDGTLGHYCHLKKDSVCVEPGERVRTGQFIARSGNTGFSSGPHLHFSVFKTQDGKTRISIPVKFKTADDPVAVTLMEGRRYRAVATETVVANTSHARSTSEGSIGK